MQEDRRLPIALHVGMRCSVLPAGEIVSRPCLLFPFSLSHTTRMQLSSVTGYQKPKLGMHAMPFAADDQDLART